MPDDLFTGKKSLDFISFVAQPAIGENFLALSSVEVVNLKFDEDKQIVTGAALIPDQQIPRVKKNGEQFKGYFSESTVRKVAELFLTAHKQDAVNVEHKTPVEGITLIESWIVEDPIKDKSAALGFDYPKGTWMVSFKVNDTVFWKEQVKSGKVRGFSIEGEFIERVVLAENKNEQEEMGKRNLSIYKRIKEALGLEKFADDTLADGTTITADGDFIVGAQVNVVAADGSQTPMPDGTYQLSDGTMITVAGGSITEVADAAVAQTEGDPALAAAPPAAAPADGAKPDAADTDLQTQIDALKKEVDALKSAVQMKEQQLTEANAKVTSLSAEKTTLETKVVELSAQPGAEPVQKTAITQAIEKEKNTYNSRLETLRKLRAQR